MNSAKPRIILEWSVNIAILVAAACLVVLVYLRLRPNQPVRNPVTVTIRQGERFTVSELSVSPNGSLVFALQVGCHFCKESMPFYRTLTKAAAESGRKIVYIFPDPIEDSQKYLQEQGLAEGQVLQKDLHTIKVGGTPTLILLDGTNTVKDVWIGKLDDEREHQVQEAISLKASQT